MLESSGGGQRSGKDIMSEAEAMREKALEVLRAALIEAEGELGVHVSG